jgi:hypothetical protein
MNTKCEVTMDAMLYNLSREEWGEYITKMLEDKGISSSDLSEISDTLTMRATLFAELATYLDNRGGAGCGDSGHEKAYAKAQKKRVVVRKALGYTYPNR